MGHTRKEWCHLRSLEYHNSLKKKQQKNKSHIFILNSSGPSTDP